jgi:hypothetical protein
LGVICASFTTHSAPNQGRVNQNQQPKAGVHGEVTKPSEPSRQTGRFGDSASRPAVIASER